MEKEENQKTTINDHQKSKKETAKPEENLDREIKEATDQEAKEEIKETAPEDKIAELEDKLVRETCQEFDGNVIAANFNCPGQVVISGEINAVKNICEVFNSLGARRSLILPVSGAFHSSLMSEAKNELTDAINNTSFNTPICPIYQNVDAAKTDDVQTIKKNLINQLTAPVLWTQIINNMIKDGLTEFIEIGPGKVLQGLIRKINREVSTQGALG